MVPLLLKAISNDVVVAVADGEDGMLVSEFCPASLASWCDVESEAAAFAGVSFRGTMGFVDCLLTDHAPLEFLLYAMLMVALDAAACVAL